MSLNTYDKLNLQIQDRVHHLLHFKLIIQQFCVMSTLVNFILQLFSSFEYLVLHLSQSPWMISTGAGKFVDWFLLHVLISSVDTSCQQQSSHLENPISGVRTFVAFQFFWTAFAYSVFLIMLSCRHVILSSAVSLSCQLQCCFFLQGILDLNVVKY